MEPDATLKLAAMHSILTLGCVCRYDNILAWQMDKEANSSMPPEQLPEILKPRPMDTMRPLYAGLDVMLNLMFRRLAYDPAQPNAPFSYDACLRVMKRQDKEMGS